MKIFRHSNFNRIFRIAALLIAGAMTLPASIALGQAAPSLPGGASSLHEAYQDWRVACQIVQAVKRCVISQQQAQQNGQPLLAIELQPGPANTTTGNLVLPFGLLLDAGVTLQIDEQPAMPPARFRTCLPADCIVTLNLDQSNLAKLRAGTTLKLRAKSSDTEQDIAFAISLKCFAAGLDRIKSLVAN